MAHHSPQARNLETRPQPAIDTRTHGRHQEEHDGCQGNRKAEQGIHRANYRSAANTAPNGMRNVAQAASRKRIPTTLERARDHHATDNANGKHNQPAAIQQAVLVPEDSRRHGHMHAPCDVASPAERIAQQHHRAEHRDERDKA